MPEPIRPTAETLLGIGLFASLPPEERERVADMCRAARFPAGRPVVTYREPSSDVYFVVSGRVRATIYSHGGREVDFRDLGPGDPFGDIAAIDGGVRSADVTTLEPTVLAWLSAAGFREVIGHYPGVADAVMRRLAWLVRALTDRVLELSTLGVNNRLHSELLRLADPHPDGSAEIRGLPTHQELANRISTHREAVTRELRRLESGGVIHRHAGLVRVPDLARLRRMVEEVKGS